MHQRSSLALLTLLAAASVLAAGCSSSSSSSTTAPASTSAAPVTTSAAPATTSATPATATAVTAADCKLLKSIGTSAIGVLTPLQTDPKAKAVALIKSYAGKLTADEAKLTSAKAKANLGAFITALEKSGSESQTAAQTALITAMGGLSDGCS